MLEEFQYEIIISVIALIIIVIYFLKKTSKQKAENELIGQEQNNIKKFEHKEKVTFVEDTPLKNPKKEEEFTLNKDEGSFGDIDKNPFEDENPLEDDSEFRQKIEVPAHGKISKASFKDFAGVKILIAEDNIINQKVLNGLLGDSGIKITMADDGQIALDILEKNNNFNMVLMDANMPRVDGFEATRRIRANPNYKHIVVVALSGDTAADDVKKMKIAGMQEHLEKPLRMDALYDVLYAYTKNTPIIEHDEYIEYDEQVEVVMTKELNGDKGLSVCGGDEDFYKDILNEFTQNYKNSANIINNFITNKDFKSADSFLLDIVGITANIGSDGLNLIAQNLKEALKDTELNNCNSLLGKYERHLKILLNDIENYKNT